MTYTTQDGKTAVPVNPNGTEVPKSACVAAEWHTFERNNPPLPLTTERPDLIGKEFQGEVVEQGSDDKINWYCEDLGYYQYFRQALSVPVKGEEKLPYTLHRSGEEAAYTNGLDDGAIHGWNSAIDAAIKVAENTYSTHNSSDPNVFESSYNAAAKYIHSELIKLKK